jgi:hypothetical protein
MKRSAARKVREKRPAKAEKIDPVEERMKEMERRGELVFEPKTNFGPLPVIKLARKLREGELQRIIRAAKRG